MKVTAFTNANAARLIDETKTPEYKAFIADVSAMRAEVARNDETVTWTDSRLVKIVRLRLLSDPGFPWWDVSYCWGKLRDGRLVSVELPWSQIPKRNMKSVIYAQGTKDGVYVNRLGLFEAIDGLQ